MTRRVPYTSSSLATSRKMVASGSPHYEAHAIIYDLMTRASHLEATLRYYDHAAGKQIADQALVLRNEAQRRIKRLPSGDLRDNLTRQNLHG